MNVALILAGGVGRRMGANVPKQFIEVLGKPIIAYTLEIFEKNKNIDAAVVVCVHGYEEQVQQIVQKYALSKVRWITQGGDTFQESVYKGLLFLQDKCSPDDIVMIHMSVAPFIDDEIIDDALKVCMEKGNSISKNECLLCMGSRDTDEYSTKSVLRENIIGLNTPQTFYLGELLSDYVQADNEGYLYSLEPHTTSLEYHLGKTLYFSKGSQLNIKITNQDDLDLFEAFWIMKQRWTEKKEYSSMASCGMSVSEEAILL